MNAMLKAQMLATALNVYFSDSGLGGNQIQAPAPICGIVVDLTYINKPIGSAIYIDCSASGGAKSLTVAQMLTYAASQSNMGGSIWYQNIRTSQGLAKAAFEAVNCRKTIMPHISFIGWANIQWPPTMTYTISTTQRTDNVYGQVWINGITSQIGQTPTLQAQLGMGPVGSNPDGNASWTWVEASFNTDAGNSDELVASLLPDTPGTYSYVYRYSFMGDSKWLYADLNGPVSDGQIPSNPGILTVN